MFVIAIVNYRAILEKYRDNPNLKQIISDIHL